MEKVVWRGRMSYRSQWGLLLTAALLWLAAGISPPFCPALLWLALPGLLFAAAAAVAVRGSEYMLTDRRIYAKYGIIARRIAEAELAWATSVLVVQSYAGRLLNYGDVTVATPGEAVGYVTLKGVRDPLKLRSMVLETVRKARERAKVEEKLRELERDCDYGRLPEELCERLRKKYQEELERY